MKTLDEMDFERGVWSAALDGETSRVQIYLNEGGDPDATDSSGYTALHYAARNGHADVCQLLLQRRATVDARTRSGRATPLHRAAYCGHISVLKLLLKNGASVSACDADGKTALHHAAGKGHTEAMQLLLQSEPNACEVKDIHGRRAIDCVPSGDQQAQLRKLLDKC